MQGTMEENVLDIILSNWLVMSNNMGNDKMHNSGFDHGTKILIIINARLLKKFSGNQPSFPLFNTVVDMYFGSKDPFASYSVWGL